MTPDHPERSSEAIRDLLMRVSPDYAPTPLHDLPHLAARLELCEVFAKDESRRALGNFKSLGGTYAGLNALARSSGISIESLLAEREQNLPRLLCASDGNHGLAVAAAAAIAGTNARVYLHAHVPRTRSKRIQAQGAEVVRIDGTYDDAVDAAAAAALRGEGILIPDTTDNACDPVVRDVMDGYAVIASEVRQQLTGNWRQAPTHIFVQAGVGGLAATMARDLKGWMSAPAEFVVVEPVEAACVTAALECHRPVRIQGDLATTAELLSCGEASAPALRILAQKGVSAVSVPEALLSEAPQVLADSHGPRTTPSGAAGLAGLLMALEDRDLSTRLQLDATSRILLFVTEGIFPEDAP
ncbi:MAG TPA: pyridoxal-phosphate dependent enzyme [Nitrospiraceae bacterium]|nr:pyridoxal-phosphate dependent enzyme [Nitrospiraceae bacterium]